MYILLIYPHGSSFPSIPIYSHLFPSIPIYSHPFPSIPIHSLNRHLHPAPCNGTRPLCIAIKPYALKTFCKR